MSALAESLDRTMSVMAKWWTRPRAFVSRHRTLVVVAGAVLALTAGKLVLDAVLGPVVAAYPVERRPLAQRVVVTGRVLAPARLQLGSVAIGRVIAVLHDVGERVRGGEVLVQLDDASASAAVAQAQAQVAQAESRQQQLREVVSRLAAEKLDQARARRLQAEDKLRRAQTLAAAGTFTVEQRDDAQRAFDIAVSEEQAAAAQLTSAGPRGAEYRQAQAALAEAEATLAGALARLADTRIAAPAPGIVVGREVEVGDVVQPGKTLMVVVQDGETRLVVEPDEKNLAYLGVGQEALASADAFPAERFAARVAYVSPAVDPARGTVEVRLTVPSPPAYLRPDMTVSVDIEVGRNERALVLPAAAVRTQHGEEPWVLVVSEGRTARRPVTVGMHGTGEVELASGVAEGELVVPPSAGGPGPDERVRAVKAGGAGAL